MALFRKKIPVERYWEELFIEFYNPDLTTQDCLRILFPDFQPNTHNIFALLSEAGLKREDVIHFKILACISALTCLSYRQAEYFPRFRNFLSALDSGGGLIDLLSRKKIDSDPLLSSLVEHFMERRMDAMPPWARNGSKVVGVFSELRADVAERGDLSNIAISFLVDFYSTQRQPISDLIKTHLGESRDEFMYLLAALQRLENDFLRSVKPI